ncbi:CCA tRNA nucleotidyltransferase [Enterococcus dongliensis]|uniref:CCA-adding enzyme n=1 Tax=Enterococcus dongliensis TaxID=2559925 RepID=A0AAP5KQG7_9ENTE|nr:CCA tRNA nucleotidyltransferase [Enterococcus dongliensis]MDT2596089.1 CCA tRNA nucleotidyltransferase [Enterococcus dongliensis]MDT2603531.1 CCA tRNA nucleotidyltransferase [Enterococcus dongliensis]MDT2635259.1 CCA tRNA nucleotidyltransferase [Enterococcus dongliensis]MDT2636943.1 CCA tRNA nucleotidyltransferase [Enterococcus dongliensis]MDT2641963.1 CCA tRNA nucleotidyltransferase [Enterococcus dongliensis]
MKLDAFPLEFQGAMPILRKLQSKNYEAYYVGGSVRDILLNKPIHDVDIATSAFPAEVKELFHRTIDVGIDHGTVMVITKEATYEVTTFRTESTYQDYRRPDHVEFVRSLKEDLKRRDFTINALAVGIDGTVIDLFDGLADLRNKVLRAVGDPYERFHEDALRMMRALRFVSQLGFTLEPDTFEAIQEYHSLLAKISVERINVEFVKLMMGSSREAGLHSLVESECYIYCPGLREYGEALLNFAELRGPAIPTERQAWTLLMMMLDLNSADIRHFMKEWKCSNQLIREVTQMVPALQLRLKQGWDSWTLYQLGRELALSVEYLLYYFEQEPNLEKVRLLYQFLPIYSLKDLAVKGNEVMEHFDYPRGPWISTTLNALERAVVAGELANHKEELFRFAEDFLKKEQP